MTGTRMCYWAASGFAFKHWSSGGNFLGPKRQDIGVNNAIYRTIILKYCDDVDVRVVDRRSVAIPQQALLEALRGGK